MLLELARAKKILFFGGKCGGGGGKVVIGSRGRLLGSSGFGGKGGWPPMDAHMHYQ